jgi:hypothetical protein
MTDLTSGQGRVNKKCIQTLGGKTSWKTPIYNTGKEMGGQYLFLPLEGYIKRVNFQ